MVEGRKVGRRQSIGRQCDFRSWHSAFSRQRADQSGGAKNNGRCLGPVGFQSQADKRKKKERLADEEQTPTIFCRRCLSYSATSASSRAVRCLDVTTSCASRQCPDSSGQPSPTPLSPLWAWPLFLASFSTHTLMFAKRTQSTLPLLPGR
jgi:hypothetical protein